MPRRQPQGYTVWLWEAMQGVALLGRDELVRERGRVHVQVKEDAALARAIHVSQLDAVWPPGPETDLAETEVPQLRRVVLHDVTCTCHMHMPM